MAGRLRSQNQAETRIRPIAARDAQPGSVVVASADVAPGILHAVEISELRKIGIWRDDEGLLAIDLQCPHMGADLAEGWIGESDQLHCPWHGYVFSIRGACLLENPNIEAMRRARGHTENFDPDLAPRFRLRTLPIEEVGDALHVQVTP